MSQQLGLLKKYIFLTFTVKLISLSMLEIFSLVMLQLLNYITSLLCNLFVTLI